LTGGDRITKEATIMNRIPLTSLTMAAVCLTVIGVTASARAQQEGAPAQLVTNGPQFTPGDAAGPQAAQQNVRESAQYEALLRNSPGFRAIRVQKECGPISDPELHASCLSSFGLAGYAAIPSRYGRYSQAAKNYNN
jgi:hypothetical protein